MIEEFCHFQKLQSMQWIFDWNFGGYCSTNEEWYKYYKDNIKRFYDCYPIN